MWRRFSVRFDFLTRVCGGVPADPDMVEAWLKARAPKVRPPQSKSIDQIAEEVFATLPTEPDEEEQQTLNCFQRVDGVLQFGYRTIRGHIKELAGTLSALYVGKIEKEKSFAVKVKNGVYYPPESIWIPLRRTATGAPVTEPDGTYQKAVHIMTHQGPRSALKTIEYVEGASMEFTLLVLNNTQGKLVVSEMDLKTLFEYGGVHGFGPERGDGQGKYVATITAEAS
jgi:hypothetical protein